MIRLRDVQFAYRPGQPVLASQTLTIGSGLTLLIGANGSGKSTLLKILAGIERPDSGTAEILGFDLWAEEVEARRELAYVSEHPDLTPYATIRDVMTLVCRLRGQPRDTGTAALTRAGLAPLATRSIRELSMGQRRRAVLAAAWIGSPKVVLLDEPLEAMDRVIRGEILGWVARLIAADAAVVIATHQIEPFVDQAVRVVALRQGQWTVLEPLPANRAERLALCASL